MSHRIENHPGAFAAAFAGVGVAALLIDIAVIAAAQTFHSSLSTAFATFGGSFC